MCYFPHRSHVCVSVSVCAVCACLRMCVRACVHMCVEKEPVANTNLYQMLSDLKVSSSENPIFPDLTKEHWTTSLSSIAEPIRAVLLMKEKVT